MRHARVEQYAEEDYLKNEALAPGKHEPWVEVFRRTPAGWTQDIYEAGETVVLHSVDLELPLAELYADTDIDGLATVQTP
jgi:hypothetical protein